MSKTRTPRKQDDYSTWNLLQRLGEYGIKLPEYYTLHVCDVHAGRCNWKSQTLVVPLWAMHGPPLKDKPKDPEYCVYYACHEIAHAIAGREAKHGPVFMEVFKAVCPPPLQHYELLYKPRNAAAAGIEAAPKHWRKE